MQLKKRVTCLILAVMVLVCSVCACVVPVYAGSFYDGYRIGKDFVDSLVGGFTKGFTTGMDVADYITEIFDAMKSDYSDYYDPETDSFDTQSPDAPITYNSTTQEFNISQNFYTYVMKKTEDHVAKLDGYYLIQSSGSVTSLKDFILNYAFPNFYLYGNPTNADALANNIVNQANTLTNNCLNFFNMGYKAAGGYSKSFSLAVMNDDIYYLNSNGYVVHTDGSYPKKLLIGKPSSGDPSAKLYGTVDGLITNYFSTYFGAPLMIFYNKTTYDRFVNEGRHYVPKVNFPEDGLNILSGNNLSDLLGDLNLNFGDDMSDSDIQASFDRAYQVIIDALANGETPSPTPGGGDEGDSSTTLGLLQQILNHVKQIVPNLVLIQNGIGDLLEAIKDIGGGGGIGSGIGSAVGTVVGNLISDLLDKIFNGKEEVEDAVGDLVSRFSGLADTSKTKFPFSLPWDVMTVFAVLAHEAETPVFKFPIKIDSIGFNYEVTLDLKDFEGMSKLSRSFFTVIFCMIMIRLTLLMVNRGDLD